jgi:hypothetical protein
MPAENKVVRLEGYNLLPAAEPNKAKFDRTIIGFESTTPRHQIQKTPHKGAFSCLWPVQKTLPRFGG